MDVVCRDAETLGVKWRNHYVKKEDAEKYFEAILDMSLKMKYDVETHGSKSMLINEHDLITLDE